MLQLIENMLWKSRLMVFLAVIAAIISAMIMIIMGCLEVVGVVIDIFKSISSPD